MRPIENTMLHHYIPPYRRGNVQYCTWDKLAWRYEGEWDGNVEFTIPDYTVNIWDGDPRPKGTHPFLWFDCSCGNFEKPSLIDVPVCNYSKDYWNLIYKAALNTPNFLKRWYNSYRGRYDLRDIPGHYFKNPPKFDTPRLTNNNVKNLINPKNWVGFNNAAKVNGSIKMTKTIDSLGRLVLGWYLYGSCHNCTRVYDYVKYYFRQHFSYEYKGPPMEE